jgi:hypothetical protein
MRTPRTAYRSTWIRRTHALLGLISALNLLVLIGTGLMLQHAALLGLDERSVSRGLLPPGYRAQDGNVEVRADIVIADLHSGRLFGTAGRLFLDGVTLVWLVMLTTGLVMYSLGRGRGGPRPVPEAASENDEPVVAKNKTLA